MLERVEAVLDDLEVLVLVVGQVGDQDRRLALDQADQADGAAGDGVGDEQLLAVDDVVVAVELGRGPQGGQVGAGARARSARTPRAARRWPAGAGSAAFCSGVPKVRSGSTAPMQPWTEASPATVGLDRGHLGQEPREGRERGPLPPYSGSTSRPQ